MKVCWGKKVICPLCKTTFYDMQKKELRCPSCQKKLKPADFQKKHRTYRKKSNENDNDLNDQLLSDKYDISDNFDDFDNESDNIQSFLIKE